MNGKQKLTYRKVYLSVALVLAFILLLGIMVGMILRGNKNPGIDTDLNFGISSETETGSGGDTTSAIEKDSETDANTKMETEMNSEPENRKTIGNLLLTALQPVGRTMYIWGGGWNEEDTGAGIEAVTIGVSPRWEEYAAQQDAFYDYNTTRFQIHDGLDCSGYMGWCIYNVMETESGKPGYVMKATDMALAFSNYGWGDYTEASKVREWKAGDIMSMKGHVWLAIGTCSDGSVVLLHSSPPGVSLAGTLLKDGSKSEAVKLAESYMSTYYPEWYAKYPNCGQNISYITTAAAMHWNRETLADEEGLTEMSAEEVLKWMFSDR